MKDILANSLLALALSAGFGTAVVSAQQTPAQEGAPSAAGDSQQTERGVRRGRLGARRGRDGRRGGELGLLRQLNLTETQQQQLRALQEENAQATKAQRDELRQLGEVRMQGGQMTAEQETRARELRQQLSESTRAMFGRVSGILTPEQRTEFERMMTERQSRRDAGRGRQTPPVTPDSQ